jgi:hypothetical protein
VSSVYTTVYISCLFAYAWQNFTTGFAVAGIHKEDCTAGSTILGMYTRDCVSLLMYSETDKPRNFNSNTSYRRSNFQIYDLVVQIHHYICLLPQQVLRSQPIYFTDAFGKEAPFHLEFVYSAEVCRLQINDRQYTKNC